MAQTDQVLRFLRFLGAGGFSVLLYYVLLFALTDVLEIWYMVSATAASLLKWVINFLLQKHWTFKNKDKDGVYKQAFQYSFLAGGLFLANLGFLYLLVEFGGIWYITAQAIIMLPLSLVSYVVTSRIFPTPLRLEPVVSRDLV